MIDIIWRDIADDPGYSVGHDDLTVLEMPDHIFDKYGNQLRVKSPVFFVFHLIQNIERQTLLLITPL